MTQTRWDVLIVGAGPAGMAAAVAAASHGAKVAVIDDNHATGGQIWRGGPSSDAHPVGAEASWREDFRRANVTFFPGRRVVAAPAANQVDTWRDGDETVECHNFHKLILATGARERFLPFPGWTLPGVYGAGGLQALVRGGYDVRSLRVLIAGTGPLLLAVAAHLREDGAQVIAVCEQSPLRQILSFGMRLWNKPSKLRQSFGLLRKLRRVPYRRSCWPVAAYGAAKLESVELSDGKRRWVEKCDLLACGFHLVPNTELASLLGCELQNGSVVVDDLQRTSVADVYCAGEPVGIAGVEAALAEGSIAGHAAAEAGAQAKSLISRAKAERGFGEAVDRAFRLRPELARLATPETIVCRCEDVRYAALEALAQRNETWTDAKLQTRCGMGPCQGRICGPAVETLFGWTNTSVRPPIFPLPLGALASGLCSTDVSSSLPQETE